MSSKYGNSVMIPSDEAASKADDIIDGEKDSYMRGQFRKGKDRRDFAMIAANISQDRYSAGSTAARVAICILLAHGLQAAMDFVADMEHHEN